MGEREELTYGSIWIRVIMKKRALHGFLREHTEDAADRALERYRYNFTTVLKF